MHDTALAGITKLVSPYYMLYSGYRLSWQWFSGTPFYMVGLVSSHLPKAKQKICVWQGLMWPVQHALSHACNKYCLCVLLTNQPPTCPPTHPPTHALAHMQACLVARPATITTPAASPVAPSTHPAVPVAPP